MSDIINLLPENIANQIAAGEVIQRPASAVKELLENAVDAGATEIRLIVNDAGKSLIQVIDNGSGMSETDARMCFERHATSKIKKIDDLFAIKTMGFRGEALASIAGVAQVDIKTKRAEDPMGTALEISNSIVTSQLPVATNNGTNISMKNLFFNIPARRNFLKSNAAEMRHIVDEFVRVAMAFPGIFFSLTSNGQEVFHLEKGNLKQRVVQILGNHYSSKLVQVAEDTDYINIYGFVGKPETAKKTRGDQYFFVNNRFIRSAYLNHAVVNAFSEMIPKDSFPMYALFISIDPARLDVNVHPTKQEIKFEDEKLIYAFVHSAVKHSLAQYSITPTLDFNLDQSIQHTEAVSQPFTTDRQNAAMGSDLYETFTKKNQAHFVGGKSNFEKWEGSLMQQTFGHSAPEEEMAQTEFPLEKATLSKQPSLENLKQLHQCFIVAENQTGWLIIHQQNAHERILYERFASAMEHMPIATQPSLFPSAIELTPADTTLLTELLPDLKLLGFLLEPFGANSFIIQGTPAEVPSGNDQQTIESLLERYKHFNTEGTFSKKEKLIRSMAWQRAIKSGTSLTEKEMKALVSELFVCNIPNATPSGKPTYMEFKKVEMEKLFGR